MPRLTPRNRSKAESSKVILSEEQSARIRDELLQRGCEFKPATGFMAGVNGAVVHAYHLTKQFPTAGEEKAWCRSRLKEIERFNIEYVRTLLEQKDDLDDLQALAQVQENLGKLSDRYRARLGMLETQNKRGKLGGRSVLVQDLVRLWRVHFHQYPKYPLPNRKGEIAPFLYVLGEVVKIAENIRPDSEIVESLRPLIAEAIRIDDQNFRREFHAEFLR